MVVEVVNSLKVFRRGRCGSRWMDLPASLTRNAPTSTQKAPSTNHHDKKEEQIA